jgi:hypothetical protein
MDERICIITGARSWYGCFWARWESYLYDSMRAGAYLAYVRFHYVYRRCGMVSAWYQHDGRRFREAHDFASSRREMSMAVVSSIAISTASSWYLARRQVQDLVPRPAFITFIISMEISRSPFEHHRCHSLHGPQYFRSRFGLRILQFYAASCWIQTGNTDNNISDNNTSSNARHLALQEFSSPWCSHKGHLAAPLLRYVRHEPA